MKSSSACHVEVLVNAARKPVKHRTSYTVSFRCRILDQLIALEASGVLFPQKVLLTLHHGLSKASISEWSKRRLQLLRARSEGLGPVRKLQTGTKVQYPLIENELYMIFLWRRDILGLSVDGKWLQKQMLTLLRDFEPAGWRTFKCSTGWLGGFKVRYRISYQCRTVKKYQTIISRLPKIKGFHRWLRALQRSGVQRCPIYGRFPADHMFHMDQSPLPFVLFSNRSLNSIGKPCFIRMPYGSGLDKRMATIQLCLRAAGEQIVRIAIVFRGKGVGLCAEERVAYAALSGLLAVYFQPKAWVDEYVALLWLEQFIAETGNSQHEKLLGMDQHGAQMTSTFQTRCIDKDIIPAYTPPDTTDVTAPCDHHVFARLKQIINCFYEAELEQNWMRWSLPPDFGGLRAWERRVYLATWTALAWQILRSEPDFIKSSFTSTGWCIAKDGSEDALYKVAGVDDYRYDQD